MPRIAVIRTTSMLQSKGNAGVGQAEFRWYLSPSSARRWRLHGRSNATIPPGFCRLPPAGRPVAGDVTRAQPARSSRSTCGSREANDRFNHGVVSNNSPRSSRPGYRRRIIELRAHPWCSRRTRTDRATDLFRPPRTHKTPRPGNRHLPGYEAAREYRSRRGQVEYTGPWRSPR